MTHKKCITHRTSGHTKSKTRTHSQRRGTRPTQKHLVPSKSNSKSRREGVVRREGTGFCFYPGLCGVARGGPINHKRCLFVPLSRPPSLADIRSLLADIGSKGHRADSVSRSIRFSGLTDMRALFANCSRGIVTS